MIASVSGLADLATIVGVVAAMATAVVAYREWRHRSRHWLYIPAPNVFTQDPAEPDFWVFPPTMMDDGTYALVIAGKIINAGPSDAFSVRVFVEPESDVEQAVEALESVLQVAAAHPNSSGDAEKISAGFVDAYKNRFSFIPVLPTGQARPFVVVARLERGDEYLESLLELSDASEISLYWEEEGRQVHGVQAQSRTALGRRLSFTPEKLCAPFENERLLDLWFSRPGSRPRRSRATSRRRRR